MTTIITLSVYRMRILLIMYYTLHVRFLHVYITVQVRNTIQLKCSSIRKITAEIWKQGQLLLVIVTWIIDPSSFSTPCLTWCYLRPWLSVSKQT